MQRIAEASSSVPFIMYISRNSGLAPEYVTIALAAACFIIIQNTAMGAPFANLLGAVMVLRDAILALRTPTARISEVRKHLIVMAVYVLFVALESIGLGAIIPLFGVLKIGLVLWTGACEENATVVNNLVFSRIPSEYLEAGNGIENAVRKAAKAVDVKIEQAKKADKKTEKEKKNE